MAGRSSSDPRLTVDSQLSQVATLLRCNTRLCLAARAAVQQFIAFAQSETRLFGEAASNIQLPPGGRRERVTCCLWLNPSLLLHRYCPPLSVAAPHPATRLLPRLLFGFSLLICQTLPSLL